MSDLARLREHALNHLSSRQVRYPVCLDPELRDELRRLSTMLKTVADAAATKAAEAAVQGSTEDAPKRRTISDKPVPTADLADAAERAMAPMSARVREILDAATEADQLVLVVCGLPPEAADDPAGYYENVAGKYPNRTLSEAAILRELTTAAYLRTESPAGEDLGFDWDTARTRVLNHADLEVLDRTVLELYREPSAIPFDPVSFGRPPQS